MEEEIQEEENFRYPDILEDSKPDQNNTNNNQRRDMCLNGCDRPANVCLCKELPSSPLLTSTQIVILHHPHELRHKLATVPILAKCITNCETLIGRRLRSGKSPLLDSLYSEAVNDSLRPRRAIFLFPGTDSVNLDEIEIKDPLVLIVFDGTWKHAKEMVISSLPFLSKFATKVCLKYDTRVDGENIFGSELLLRKEPFSGCMSTIEAVARSLRVLEPDETCGVEIEERLISVLRAMVRFQSIYTKPIKPRPKLAKKGKKDKKIEKCEL